MGTGTYGKVSEGLADIRLGIDNYRATGSEYQLPYFFALLASVLGAECQFDEALALNEQARDMAQRTGELWYNAEIHRQRGELLARHAGNQAEAEQWYQHALQLARSQQARSLELRSALSLARLWQMHDENERARELLDASCARFDRELDTPDLDEARALLKVLQ